MSDIALYEIIATATHPLVRRRLPVASALSLVIGLLVLAQPWAAAHAHVEIAIDPLGMAAHSGRPLVDQAVVTIAILGNDHFDPATVNGAGLLFGAWHGPQVGPLWVAPKTEDVNGDGFADRLVRFRMADEALDGFRTGKHQSLMGWLSGSYVDADGILTTFRSGALVAAPEDSGCQLACVSSSGFLRCTSGPTLSSGDQIQCSVNLVNDVFPLASNGGANEGITGASTIVFEAASGNGHGGGTFHNCGSDSAPGGKGGEHGYAVYVDTVASVLALALDGKTIFYTVGRSGQDVEEGGETTIAAGLALDNVNGATPYSVNAFVSAGGGGGGGKGNGSNSNCYHGEDGGSGGVQSGWSTTESEVCGDNGVGKNSVSGGLGGNQAQGGGCGGGKGGAATQNGYPGLDGMNGAGGLSVDNAGRGGNGYGGGGGTGRHDSHNLGGGGGGTWARASGAVAGNPGDFIVGNAGGQQLVITMEILPLQ